MGDGAVRNISGVGRSRSVACSWDMHAFTLVFLPAKSKNINGNCERGCEGKLMLKKLSLSG